VITVSAIVPALAQFWLTKCMRYFLGYSAVYRRVVARGQSVVVTATANSVSHPTHEHQQQADDQQDDPDDQNNMGESEGRHEAREQQPQDDEDDSEDDHGVYLISV
jgi:hypothetical protein